MSSKYQLIKESRDDKNVRMFSQSIAKFYPIGKGLFTNTHLSFRSPSGRKTAHGPQNTAFNFRGYSGLPLKFLI